MGRMDLMNSISEIHRVDHVWSEPEHLMNSPSSRKSRGENPATSCLSGSAALRRSRRNQPTVTLLTRPIARRWQRVEFHLAALLVSRPRSAVLILVAFDDRGPRKLAIFQ